MPNKKVVTTDVDTLKQLVSEGGHSWLHKTTTTVLICNIGLIVSISWAMVTDHFAVKSLGATSILHSSQIENLNNRETKTENQVSIHDVKINNLEKRK